MTCCQGSTSFFVCFGEKKRVSYSYASSPTSGSLLCSLKNFICITSLGMNGAWYFFSHSCVQSIPANQECCLTSRTDWGLRDTSFVRRREIKSHRKSSLVDGLRWWGTSRRRSGGCSIWRKLESVRWRGKRAGARSNYLHKILRIVLRRFPFKSKKGGTPTTNSYSKQPKAHKSDWPLYSFLRKNSGGEYSKVPKKVVVATLEPSFLVVTLEEETDEDDDASSAIDFSIAHRWLGGGIASP